MTARALGRLRLVVPPETPAVAPPRRPDEDARTDDSELIAAVRSGDDAAAHAFYDRMLPAVQRTIRRLLGTHDADVDDVLQIAMIALVEGIDRYRGECSLEGWASSVTAHVVYKHIRRRRLERRVFGSIGEHDAPSGIGDARRALLARDLVTRVRSHLDRLTEEKAWTFLLHDVCGFDLREVASITGVSVAAAQGRLVRGRRELHEHLGADPELASALRDLEAGT